MTGVERPKIVLKSGKDQSLRRFHPWIFSGAIKKIYGNVSEGDIVSVYDNKDEFLALGHYQDASIAVRVFSFQDVKIDDVYWKRKLEKALQMRKILKLADNTTTNVYRLFHGEGDGIPGLIIDYYNGHIVMQIHSIGVYRLRDTFAQILKEIYRHNLLSVYDKSESTLPKRENIKVANSHLFGEAIEAIVTENNLKFKVNWQTGQKTGFFVDQRTNRELLKKYSKDRRVLNMFSYTGGFSVYAVEGGAALVHSVDSSAKAIDLVNENIGLNFKSPNHESFAVDAFDYLNHIKDKYDLIVLDPPAFAKHQSALHNALQGYKRLNQKALENIRKGGILFTFSCSQVVNKENFRKSVFAAAANAGREVRILHQLSQPVDHPVNLFHPESEYLKGLVLYVE